MNSIAFDQSFEALTGHLPFPWQRRLFEEFQEGRLPSAVDIPTGLGKTAVMAVWLLARSVGAPVPRRLVYVIDRRAVVDQATDFALQLRQTLQVNESLGPVRRGLNLVGRSLPISTLRGQHIDNREWLDDPAAPAIIVATVDMVGSRLLFEGYGVSRRMRPYHAGLLGCDALLLLDEAHLSRPFEELLRTIESERRPALGDGLKSKPGMFAGPLADALVPPPIKVLPLSATLGFSSGSRNTFAIDREDRTNEIVRARLNAHKLLKIEDLGSDSRLDAVLASQAWDLARLEGERAAVPLRTLIYCHSRRVAEGVNGLLVKRIKGERANAEVILFVGGRRVFEREEAASKLRHCGLLADSNGPPTTPVFLVATSAGEVGVDLDADHMVCDLVPWERMVQRLGRVNRRGRGAAQIQVIDQGPPEDEFGQGLHLAVRTLLQRLPSCDGGHLAGPAAITDTGGSPEQRDLMVRASTPTPLYPPLTRPLVDAWAMTSLRDHSGRPEVDPWLRGWVRQDPQTTVVWRRLLPICIKDEGHNVNVVNLRDRTIEEFFEAASPHVAEQLQTETSRVVDWLRKRARKLNESLRNPKDHEPGHISADSDDSNSPSEDASASAPTPMHRAMPLAFVLGSGGEFEGTVRLGDVANTLNAKDLRRRLSGRVLVVDARICGLTDGLLDARNGEPVATAEDNWGKPDTCQTGSASDESIMSGRRTVRVRLISDDERKRLVDASDSIGRSVGQISMSWRELWSGPYRIASDDNVVTWLIVEKWRSTASDEESRSMATTLQTLQAHQERTASEARRIATDLGLLPADREMLVAAAHHHDDGKRAPRWQRAFNGPRDGGPYAKTPGPVNRHVLNGFRHEFQSLIDTMKDGLDGLKPSDPRFDLALHLIAAHHGNARPAIGIDGCDELPPSAAARCAFEIGQRFARLQRQWGPWGLAWWEALLRAADQRASRILDETAKLEEQRRCGDWSAPTPDAVQASSTTENSRED